MNYVDDILDLKVLEVEESFDVFNSLNINKESFKRFCEDVNFLDAIIIKPDLYLEAVETNAGAGTFMKDVVTNTKDTTKSTGKIINDFTSIKSGTIKGSFDLVSNCLKLIANIVGFFSKMIGKIPIGLNKIVQGVINIPDNVRVLIKGDIKLYITADDLVTFNNVIYPEIQNFISAGISISSGSVWTSVMQGIKDRDSSNPNNRRSYKDIIFGPNDMKNISFMEKSYNKLSNITFTKTIVKMNSANVDIYFGNKKCIKFIDKYGKTNVPQSYLNALQNTVASLNAYKDSIKKLQDQLNVKYESSELERTLVECNAKTREKILSSIKMCSKVISIVGNFTKSLIEDQQTYNKALARLRKKGKVKIGNNIINDSIEDSNDNPQ